MNIRTRLTIQFVLIVVIINLISAISIYYFSSKYRLEDFYLRLNSKANNTAKLLLDVDEIDNELLRKIEMSTPFRLYNEKIIIYNNEEEVIFSTDEHEFLKINNSLLEKTKKNKSYRFKQGEYEGLGLVLSNNKSEIIVFVAAIDIYGGRKITNLRLVLLVVFGVSVALSLVSGWIYSGRALDPILTIIEKVKKITIGSLNLRLDEGNKKDEIARLSATFNDMLSRLEIAVKAHKNFIGNASHELRTPLTALTGQLEVTLMKERSNEIYTNVLKSVLEDIKELNVISNRLLILAQVESVNIESHFNLVRIDELLWQSRQELLKTYSHYKIIVAINEAIEEESNLIINGNEQLLKIMLSNIIENGCKYSNDNTINIYIDLKGEDIIIKFTDRGIGIPQNDLENIFEPFHRAKNAMSFNGSGIGLSLVRHISKIHNADISVFSELNVGTVVTLTFFKV